MFIYGTPLEFTCFSMSTTFGPRTPPKQHVQVYVMQFPTTGHRQPPPQYRPQRVVLLTNEPQKRIDELNRWMVDGHGRWN